jgi:phosphoheptose isomerase
MTDRDGIDAGRRRMLLRLGLTATAIYTAPALARLSTAKASPGSGASRSSVSISRPAPPEIVVTAPTPADINLIAAQGYGLLSRDRLELMNAEIARFSLPRAVTIGQARAQILDLVPAALFDLNHLYQPGEFTCGADGCAAFAAIGWNAAAHACPAGTTIGVADTAINLDHEALAGIDIETLRVAGEDRAASSAVHGTTIAVLLEGRRDSRTPGLLDGVRLIAAEAFHRTARGRDMSDSYDVARAIDRLARRGASVINLSLTGARNTVLQGVVAAARARGVVLVAAAGNEGPNAEPLYPAAFAEVIAVTAVDRDSQVYRQANQGEHVYFAAPGVRLWTAASVRGGRFRSGTSYAVPFVSAAFAVARAREPDKSIAELIEEFAGRAVDLGPPGRDPVFGYGLVQSDGQCLEEAAAVLIR